MVRKFTIMIVMCLLVFVCLISGCKAKYPNPEDATTPGNTAETPEKYVPECTADDGCTGDQKCANGTCKDPECADCTYLDVAKHTCEKYECCTDKDCASAEKCSYNKCVAVECGECGYAENHACVGYKCCSDDGCNDSNDGTNDTCENPGTADAKCLHKSSADCGKSFSCFTGFLEDCEESRVVLNLESEDSNYTWEYNLQINITGETDDECGITMRMMNLSAGMTDNYYEELENAGNDEDEIDEILDDKNEDVDDYEGDRKKCSINTDYLDDVKATFESWLDDDEFNLEEFNCDSLTS
ncbi:hypothetical protein COV19_06685 [Candidatus Woesearchaeota archaeon CG10_big_fil_rev_8_21_14_0_10_44_13]|nr:MAG: hypothetical protein COV19_06685 [Candidatus Woesearchaeota archaeon CG10_big_fil_rev_8_21_14_0_10_44_13]